MGEIVANRNSCKSNVQNYQVIQKVIVWCVARFVTICTIHKTWKAPMENSKNVKSTHGGVLLLVKLQALACNFTKNNAPPWVFFTFFKLLVLKKLPFLCSRMRTGAWIFLHVLKMNHLQYWISNSQVKTEIC